MKIEILTTKKKLTKSIISQMTLVKMPDIEEKYKILGKLQNCRKNYSRVILVEKDEKYSLINCRLKLEKNYPRVSTVLSFPAYIDFPTQQDAEAYRDYFHTLYAKTEQIYI